MTADDRWALMQARPEQDPAGTIELPENGLGAHVAGIAPDTFWAHVDRALAQRCPRAREPREIHACLVPIVEELLAGAGGAAHPDGR